AWPTGDSDGYALLSTAGSALRDRPPHLFCRRVSISYPHGLEESVTMVDEVDAGSLDAGFSSTKKQILLTLKRKGSTSLTDLAGGLRISKMATLKHLTVLEAKGLIERSSRSGGRGRPRAFFALSKGSASLFPEAYTHMTLCALRFIEEKIGRERSEERRVGKESSRQRTA